MKYHIVWKWTAKSNWNNDRNLNRHTYPGQEMLLSIDINFKSKKRKETNMKIIKQIGEIERDWRIKKETNKQRKNEWKKEREKEDRTRSQRERERGGQLSVWYFSWHQIEWNCQLQWRFDTAWCRDVKCNVFKELIYNVLIIWTIPYCDNLHSTLVVHTHTYMYIYNANRHTHIRCNKEKHMLNTYITLTQTTHKHNNYIHNTKTHRDSTRDVTHTYVYIYNANRHTHIRCNKE